MLRAIPYYGLFIPLTFILASIAAFFPGRDNHRALWVQRTWGRLGLRLAGIRVQAELAPLTPGQTYLFMANHQSMFDILVLADTLRDWDVRFIAKQSLFEIPVFGKAMHNAGNISIDREHGVKAMRALNDAAKMMESGENLVLFPEGTRSLDPTSLQEFKIGGMVLALKAKVPVAPLLLDGTAAIKQKNTWRIRPGLVRVRALTPFTPQDDYTIKERERLKADLQERMEHAYQTLRSEAPSHG